MGGRPRAQQWVQRPSPLAQVHHTRPVSQAPSHGLVRDPQFWKRFSTAIHQAEESSEAVDPEKGGQSTKSSVDMRKGDGWLVKQQRKKRKCRRMCALIALVVCIIIVAAAVVGWYFTRVHT